MSKLLDIYPIEGVYGKDFYLTQGYGLTDFAKSSTGKRYYRNFPGGIHPGNDWGTHRINRKAISTIPGKVVLASLNGGWGNSVEVMGEDGWRRQYAHLESIDVKVGDVVERGQVLGRVGTTGSSTAIHLHYGHRKWIPGKGWVYRDPSVDYKQEPEMVEMPTSRFIKSANPKNRAVYVFNGHTRFPIPDWETFLILSGKKTNQAKEIEEVSDDILSKIPQGQLVTSFR